MDVTHQITDYKHQIKDYNTDRNIFVRYRRDDTMDVQELQNIMAEYGKIKSIKVIHHQNGGIENRAMICYETEMKGQRAITEINRFKGWKAEKYITNKATRTGNWFEERTNTSSRETETEENYREKTNQSGIKDKRTCYACATKGHKIKDCESKLNIFSTFKENLSSKRTEANNGSIWNCKKHQYKRSTNRTEKNKQWFIFQRKERHKKLSQK